jgi:hypothetical protein
MIRVLAFFLLAGLAPLSAEIALLVEEPFGTFGSVNPTGHAAIYLSRVCAETPTLLRRCGPGERGIVLSRYHRIAGYDWIAIPLVPYLYAVNEPEQVPASATTERVAMLRDRYRRWHFQQLAPDGPEGEPPRGDWVQLVGAAYDRTLYGFALETTPADDDRLIAYLNARPNRQCFHLLFRNCADFARGIVNFYYPHALGRSLIADAGISTPKHSAKMLVSYGRRRPELHLASFVIPQIAGEAPSTRLRGVSESLVRSKKYVVPLLVLQPWAAATAGAAYLATGRFDPRRQAHEVCGPLDLSACMATAGSAAPPVLDAASTPPVPHAPGASPFRTVSSTRTAVFPTTSRKPSPVLPWSNLTFLWPAW